MKDEACLKLMQAEQSHKAIYEQQVNERAIWTNERDVLLNQRAIWTNERANYEGQI